MVGHVAKLEPSPGMASTESLVIKAEWLPGVRLAPWR